MMELNKAETRNYTDLACSIDSAFSSASNTSENTFVQSPDNRIACSSSKNLDFILRTVASNVNRSFEKLNLGNEKSQAMSRVMEIFKDNLQENITMNGLPYVANEDCLSMIQKEKRNQEADDALLSELSKKLTATAYKRKTVPKEYGRILKMKLQHDRRNLERAEISHNIKQPILTSNSFCTNTVSSSELKSTRMNIESHMTDVMENLNEIKRIKQNQEYAQDLLTKKSYLEVLHDTGYNSS